MAKEVTQPEDIFEKQDSMPKHMSQCMNELLDKVEVAHNSLAADKCHV